MLVSALLLIIAVLFAFLAVFTALATEFDPMAFFQSTPKSKWPHLALLLLALVALAGSIVNLCL